MQRILHTSDTIYMKFCIKFAFLILLVIMADQIIGGILRHFYFKQVAGQLYRATYSMDSTTADFLVLGSSRANHHYVPTVFENSMNMSFYNAGRDGSYILSNIAFFRAIVKRYHPEIILFDMDPNELYYSDNSYEQLSDLLPYYKTHPEIKSIIELRGPFEKYKNFSAIYPFNSCILKIGIGNLEINKKRRGDIKGFVPLKRVLADSIPNSIPFEAGKIDQYKLDALVEMMQYCSMHNIRLYLIHSPAFVISNNSEASGIVDQIAKKNQTIFWSFSEDSTFLATPEYFSDFRHLNETGANYFSAMVAHRLIDCKKDRIENRVMSVIH